MNRLSASVHAAALILAIGVVARAGAVDLQGHRGARGLAPENTLAGFRRALEVGVSTLETDLALTRDGMLVLSHDTRLSAALTRDSHGRWLAEDGGGIRELTLQQLAAYDVGRLNPAHRATASSSTTRIAHGARWKLGAAID